MPGEVPTNPNQPTSDFSTDGEIKAPQIEWIKNTPATTTHLPCADSSWLQSVSYDSGSLRMTITTKTGSSWQHAMVYPAQFTELQMQPSKGSYYTRTIKGQHPTTHIIKTPKLGNFPKEQTKHAKDRYQNPIDDRYKEKPASPGGHSPKIKRRYS